MHSMRVIPCFVSLKWTGKLSFSSSEIVKKRYSNPFGAFWCLLDPLLFAPSISSWNVVLGGTVLVLGFMSLGLLGPSDPVARCVFRGFAEYDVVSEVVFWAEGGLIDVFDKFERFWPFGAVAP